MSSWSKGRLTPTQRNALLKALRSAGLKPPPVGGCIRALGGKVCRHRPNSLLKGDTGYQVVRIDPPPGLKGDVRGTPTPNLRYPLAYSIRQVKLMKGRGR